MSDEKKLLSQLEEYIKIKFEAKQYENGLKYIELKNLGIKNHYDLEISDCSLFYETSFRSFIAPYICKVNYNIVDCLPRNPNLKLSCSIEGTTLTMVLEKFIEHISSKVYCRDCGKLCNDKDFCMEEDQCMSCVLETLLLNRKRKPIFCSICQQETCRYITLQCGHTFHRRCVSKLLKNNCPLCSKSIFVV